MIVNLTENRFLQQLIFDNILPRNDLSYIFEFQLVPFTFSLILGDRYMMSPHPLKYGEERFFSRKCFSWGKNYLGKIYREIVLHGGSNDQNIPRKKKFHKMQFPVI